MIWKYFAQTFLDPSTLVSETVPALTFFFGGTVLIVISLTYIFNEGFDIWALILSIISVSVFSVFLEVVNYDNGYDDVRDVVMNKYPKDPELKLEMINQKAFQIKLHPEENFLYIINGDDLQKVSSITDVYLKENDTIYYAAYKASMHNIYTAKQFSFYFINKEDIYYPKPDVVQLKFDEKTGKFIDTINTQNE